MTDRDIAARAIVRILTGTLPESVWRELLREVRP